MATLAGGGKGKLLSAGKLEYSLDITIPENATHSFAGVTCERRYEFSVTNDLPIGGDSSCSLDFGVRPVKSEYKVAQPLHIIYPDDTGKSWIDWAFGKNVKLNLALDRDAMIAGETVLAILTVESAKTLRFNYIEAKLAGKEVSVAEGKTQIHKYRYPLAMISPPGVIPQQSVFEFEIQIPKDVGPATQSGKIFEVSWWIEIRLDVPWAKDPIFKIPIKLLPKFV